MFGKFPNRKGNNEEVLEQPRDGEAEPPYGEDLDEIDNSFVVGTASKKLHNGEEVLNEEGILNSERGDYEESLRLPEEQYRETTAVGDDGDGIEQPPYEYISDDTEMALQTQHAMQKIRLIKLGISAGVIIVLLLGIGFLGKYLLGGDDSKEAIIEDYSTSLTELVTTMYTAKDIDELANANESIVAYFADNIKEQNDIRDSNVYAQRYGYFHNRPITVSIQEVEQMNNKLFIRYTITCDVASPLTRIALVELNDEGKINRFTEYNTY